MYTFICSIYVLLCTYIKYTAIVHSYLLVLCACISTQALYTVYIYTIHIPYIYLYTGLRSFFDPVQLRVVKKGAKSGQPGETSVGPRSV